jgi:hypothetical protein
MSRIIAGRFDRSVDADAALESLRKEGFARTEYDSFYVPPPGQHATTPIGGDAHSDAGARKAGIGAAIGAVLGVGVGLAAGTVIATEFGPFTILFGAAIGAYIGSFVGAMSKLRGGRRDEATREHPVEPHGGRMIAICVDREGMQARAVAVLRRHGARDIGRAEGEWRDGAWRNFDPRVPLQPA